MALISEQIVEEWLRRQEFFTIRGMRKPRVRESDILAIRCKDGQIVEACHYEVQVSYRPVGFLVKRKVLEEIGLKAGIDLLIENKFDSDRKKSLRAQLVGNKVNWTYHFVVHELKKEEERKILEKHPLIELVKFVDVCTDLASKEVPDFSASDRDLVDLMQTLR